MIGRLSRSSKNGNVTASQALVIGGISRTISTASVLPFTVVKARFEVLYNWVWRGWSSGGCGGGGVEEGVEGEE